MQFQCYQPNIKKDIPICYTDNYHNCFLTQKEYETNLSVCLDFVHHALYKEVLDIRFVEESSINGNSYQQRYVPISYKPYLENH